MINQNLKVDHKTVIEEFKRKHNYLVDGSVRKMSAPISTNLTDEEIEMIKDGVFIEGTFAGLTNPILFPLAESGGNYRGMYMTGEKIGAFTINKTSKLFSLTDATTRRIDLNSMGSFNGKTVPVYPAADVDKYLKSEQGTLKWEDINLADIVDSQGNKRFQEGEVSGNAITGVEYSYAKWSLSGTHLMVVVAGSIANGTVIGSGNSTLFDFALPQFIADKIVPTYGIADIENKTLRFYASDGTNQATTCYLSKNSTTGNLKGVCTSLTLSADRYFRLQFDLLIDTEEPVSAGE